METAVFCETVLRIYRVGVSRHTHRIFLGGQGREIDPEYICNLCLFLKTVL
jgi:hypothetical protein